MKKSKVLLSSALFFFGIQAVCPGMLRASDNWARGLKSAVGASVGAITRDSALGNRVANASWTKAVSSSAAGAAHTAIRTGASLTSSLASASCAANNSIKNLRLMEQWEGAKQQYGYAAPIAMIGTATNPLMETITGVQAGSLGAREWGKGVYQWTGGIFNVPMVVIFGRSLSDTGAINPMSLTERGGYIATHPLEVVEYVAAVYGGASLLSGGASATVNSLKAGIQSVSQAHGTLKLVKAVSLVYGPLASAATPILAYATPLGLGAYEWNKFTGTYKVTMDGSGRSKIVDSQGKPRAIDGFSALMYGFGAKAEHIISGDPAAETFSVGMAGHSVTNNLSVLAKNLSANPDGTRNWAGTFASIPVQVIKAPFGFAEFPLSFADNIGNAQRQGWSEGLANGDLGQGLLNSSIYTGQVIGGSALGMYSFAGDVFIAGPVNFADSLRGGNGKILQANWLGETVANAPWIDRLGLGKYFNPVDPAKAEYPNIDYTIANAPYLFNLKSSVLGEGGGGGKTGYLGKVEALKSTIMKPVDILTSPMNTGLEKVKNIIIRQSALPEPPLDFKKPFNPERLEELQKTFSTPKARQIFREMRDSKLYESEFNSPETSIAELSSVIGKGKPGALITLSDEGVRFFAQPEVKNTLESMNIYQVSRKSPFDGTNEIIIYDAGRAANIIDQNPGLIVEMMPEAATHLKSSGEKTSKSEAIDFVNEMSASRNDVQGLFLGYPAESVRNYARNPSSGISIQQDWTLLDPFLQFSVAPTENGRLEAVRFATNAKVGENTVNRLGYQIESQGSFKSISAIPVPLQPKIATFFKNQLSAH